MFGHSEEQRFMKGGSIKSILVRMRGIWGRDLAQAALHLLVLWTFAVSAPLLDLLARYPTFFVARKSDPEDIFLLVALLLFLVPALLTLVEALAAVIGRRLLWGVHAANMIVLSVAIALPLMKRLAPMHDLLIVGGALGMGVCYLVLYARFGLVRLFTTLLTPVVVVSPAMFFFTPAIHDLVLSGNERWNPLDTQIERKIPIVMVVFDAFNLSVLLDEDLAINRNSFPHIAGLADDSYWFRNGTTVVDSTKVAVPAILTGRFPDASRLPAPSLKSYPNNLFTFVAGDYRLNVFEAATRMCPRESCRAKETLSQRIPALLEDTSIVYGHFLLPPALTGQLPEIGKGWGNFRKTFVPETKEKKRRKKKKRKRRDRMRNYQDFVRAIAPVDDPVLHYLHFVFPHRPVEYLASGRRYPGNWVGGRRVKGDRREDPASTHFALQRYILQASYADKLVGKLIEKLKKSGLYDRALLIMTADHGINFRPGGYSRYLSGRNRHNIVPVPFFIKLPYQKEGVVSDQNAETIDILPTIADVLGTELPFPVDGQSLLHKAFRPRNSKRVHSKKNKAFVELSPHFNDKQKTVREIYSHFGKSSERFQWFRTGKYKQFFGRPLAELGTLRKADFTVELTLPERFITTSNVNGYIFLGTAEKFSLPLDLAIAVNGVVRATVKTLVPWGEAVPFAAMVPENTFRHKSNRVDVLIIEESNQGDVSFYRSAENRIAAHAKGDKR
jgi:hypothetical protein